MCFQIGGLSADILLQPRDAGLAMLVPFYTLGSTDLQSTTDPSGDLHLSTPWRQQTTTPPLTPGWPSPFYTLGSTDHHSTTDPRVTFTFLHPGVNGPPLHHWPQGDLHLSTPWGQQTTTQPLTPGWPSPFYTLGLMDCHSTTDPSGDLHLSTPWVNGPPINHWPQGDLHLSTPWG